MLRSLIDLRKPSTFEPRGYPGDHELDRVGDFGEPLVQSPLLVTEVSAQLRFRDDARPDLVADQDHIRCRGCDAIDQSSGFAGDVPLR